MNERDQMMADMADAMERFHALAGELLDDINANGLPVPSYGAMFSSWSYLIGARMNAVHDAVKADKYAKQ